MLRINAAFALAGVLVAVNSADAAKPRTSPRSARAGEDDRARAGRGLAGPCRDEVLRELSAGRVASERCQAERRRAGRAAVRPTFSFGYVVSRDVDLRSLRMVVGRAVLCRRWPLRPASSSVLRAADIAAAGCRTRRAKAPVTVAVFASDGRRVDDVMNLRPDADGRVVLSYGALDLELRARGLGTLHDYARVEVGVDAWAGEVDLDRLREFRASWYLQWVRTGRGSAGLFASRHADHSGAAVATALAEEAELERMRSVLQAVGDGAVSITEFLLRFGDAATRPDAASGDEAAAGVTPPVTPPEG